jgi:hypothetical protein
MQNLMDSLPPTYFANVQHHEHFGIFFQECKTKIERPEHDKYKNNLI